MITNPETLRWLALALLPMWACACTCPQEATPPPQQGAAEATPRVEAPPAPVAAPETPTIPGQRLELVPDRSRATIQGASSTMEQPSTLHLLSAQLVMDGEEPRQLRWSVSLAHTEGLEARFVQLFSSPEGLDGQANPALTFESQNILGTTSGPESHFVDGKLYVRGVGYPMSFGITPLQAQAPARRFQVSFAFNPRRIGIEDESLDAELLRGGVRLVMELELAP